MLSAGIAPLTEESDSLFSTASEICMENHDSSRLCSPKDGKRREGRHSPSVCFRRDPPGEPRWGCLCFPKDGKRREGRDGSSIHFHRDPPRESYCSRLCFPKDSILFQREKELQVQHWSSMAEGGRALFFGCMEDWALKQKPEIFPKLCSF